MNIVTAGSDLARHVFALHGADQSGKATFIKPKVVPQSIAGDGRQPAALSGRHGGLLRRAPRIGCSIYPASRKFSKSALTQKNAMTQELDYKNNPLHGVSLKTLLTEIIDYYGFDILFAYLNINCFASNPSIESSVKFLQKLFGRGKR